MSNTDLNTKEIVGHKNVLSSRPALIYVELTQRCNCTCLMCYRSQTSFKDLISRNADMEKTLFKKVASQLFENAEMIDLRGFGEPTIYPHMLDTLNYLKRWFPGIKYKMISNGKAMNEKLLNAMADLNLDLYFSFDAADKRLFEHLRQGNAYDKVVGNIKRWNLHFSQNNRARLLVTLHKKNVFNIVDIAKFAVRNQCRLLSISEIDPMTGNEWIAPKKIALDELQKCFDICSSEGIDMVLPASFFQELSIENWCKCITMEECTAPYNTILVKYNGDIYACSHRFGNMGNILQQPISEIWNNAGFRRLRSRQGLAGLCRECKRNNLAYIGTRGIIREKTWQFIDRQQSEIRSMTNG